MIGRSFGGQAGYIKAVYERESEGPTGIGDQVAIPHGKTLL